MEPDTIVQNMAEHLGIVVIQCNASVLLIVMLVILILCTIMWTGQICKNLDWKEVWFHYSAHQKFKNGYHHRSFLKNWCLAPQHSSKVSHKMLPFIHFLCFDFHIVGKRWITSTGTHSILKESFYNHPTLSWKYWSICICYESENGLHHNQYTQK